jgi:hypothetical protein
MVETNSFDLFTKSFVHKKTRSTTKICQRSIYRWKDEQRKHIVKITADDIAFIVEQIENAKNKKEIPSFLILS